MPFTMPDFNEDSGWMRGMQQGQTFAKNLMMLPQELQQAILENQIKQAKARYSLPEEQQSLLKQTQENEWYPRNQQSEIGLRSAQSGNLGANTQLTNLKIKYPGLGDSGIEGQLALMRLYADHPEMTRNMVNPIGNQPGSNQTQPQTNQNINPISLLMQNLQADIGSKNALAHDRMSGGLGGGAGVKELNAISAEIRDENPNFSPEQIINARNAYMEGKTTLDDGTILKPVSGALNSLLSQNYKRGSDVSQRNQERYASTLETTFNEGDKIAPDAFKFAGLAGKTSGGIEALKSQFGENNPSYLHYLEFTRQVLPALASEILRTGGANSTDTQKTLAIQQANPINFDNNPQLAMQQYEFLKTLYKKIGKTISQGSYKSKNQLISDELNKSSSADPLGIR